MPSVIDPRYERQPEKETHRNLKIEQRSPSFSSSPMTWIMSSGNSSAAGTVKSTGISGPPDVPNAGEPLTEPLLARNTGEVIEHLSRLQFFLKGAREVAERNTGLLLVVSAQAFLSSIDTAVKILQRVEPPVTTLQVRFQPHINYTMFLCCLIKLIIIQTTITYIGCMMYMCVRHHILLRLVFASFA